MLPLYRVSFFRGFTLGPEVTVSSSCHKVFSLCVSGFPHGEAQATNGLGFMLITSSYLAESFLSEQSCILRHEELALEHTNYEEPIQVTGLSQTYKTPPFLDSTLKVSIHGSPRDQTVKIFGFERNTGSSLHVTNRLTGLLWSNTWMCDGISVANEGSGHAPVQINE